MIVAESEPNSRRDTEEHTSLHFVLLIGMSFALHVLARHTSNSCVGEVMELLDPTTTDWLHHRLIVGCDRGMLKCDRMSSLEARHARYNIGNVEHVSEITLGVFYGSKC